MNAREVAETPDFLTGTYLVNNVYAKVLFDYGANQSFINHEFCKQFKEPLAKLDKPYEVEIANGDLVKISELLENGRIILSDVEIPVTLSPMTLAGFDIVLGIDWLSANQARIICDKQMIKLCTPWKKRTCVKGDKTSRQNGIFYVLQAMESLSKGNLSFVVTNPGDKSKKEVYDVQVVADFADVFPEEPPALTRKKVEYK